MGTFAPHILADQLILLQPKCVGGSDNAHKVAPPRIFIPSAGSAIVYFRIRLTTPERIHIFIINCI